VSETPPSTLPAFLRSAWFWGLALFLLALGIRLVGIGWGLPNDIRNQSLHPDEPVIWSVSQRIEPSKARFDPGFYNYGTLYLTMVRVATDMVNAYGGGPRASSAKAQWDAIGRYHLAGRILSAAAGAGIAWVVFAILWRRTHWLGAAAGGLAAALAPGLVVHSRFQTVDIVAAFLLSVSLLYALKLIPSDTETEATTPTLKWAMLAGLFAGLSAGTKYTGFLALFTLGVACLALPAALRWRALGAGVGVAVAAFLITTPGLFLNTAKFLEDTTYEMRHTATGHGIVFMGTPSGFIYHIANLSAGMGPLLLMVGGAGLIAGVIRKKLWIIALVAFAVPYYLLIGQAEVKFFRYAIPLIPVLALGAGWLIGQCHRQPDLKWKLGVAAGIFALGGAASRSITSTFWMLDPDPRDQAARDLKQLAGPDTTVAVVKDPWFWTVSLFPDTALPRSVRFEERNRFRAEATSPKVLQYVPENPEERVEWDVRILDAKPDYVVATSFEWDDEQRLAKIADLPPAIRAGVERKAAFEARLRAEYDGFRLYGEDGPVIHDLMYIRPRVWIWKRKTDSATPSSGSSITSDPNEEPAPTR